MCRRDANPWYLEQNTGDLDMEEIQREELKHLLKTMRIRVVSAVFIDGEKVLLAQRRIGDDYEGSWECSGGKVEKAETDEKALIRECMEELGVNIEVKTIIGEIDLDPPAVKRPLSVAFYECRIVPGQTPKPLLSDALMWANIRTMNTLELMPANKALMIDVARRVLVRMAGNALNPASPMYTHMLSFIENLAEKVL